MSKLLAGLFLCLTLFSMRVYAIDIVGADSHSHMDTAYAPVISTVVTGAVVPQTFGSNLSSGVVNIDWVVVSSPGVNSVLRFHDNYLAGGTSNVVLNVPTNATGYFGPFKIETTTGAVFTSTAATPNGVWSQPSFTIGAFRRR